MSPPQTPPIPPQAGGSGPTLGRPNPKIKNSYTGNLASETAESLCRSLSLFLPLAKMLDNLLWFFWVLITNFKSKFTHFQVEMSYCENPIHTYSHLYFTRTLEALVA